MGRTLGAAPCGSLASEHDVRVTRVHLQLLGRFQVRRDGEEVPPAAFGGRKVRTLLRVLAVRRPDLVPHDVLAEALWPDRLPADPVGQPERAGQPGPAGGGRAGVDRHRDGRLRAGRGRPGHRRVRRRAAPGPVRGLADRGPGRRLGGARALGRAAGRGHLRRVGPRPAGAAAPGPGRGAGAGRVRRAGAGRRRGGHLRRERRGRGRAAARAGRGRAGPGAGGGRGPGRRAARAGRAPAPAGRRAGRRPVPAAAATAAGAAAGQRGRPVPGGRAGPPGRLRHAAVRRPRRRAGRAARGDRTSGDRGGVRARGGGQVAAGRRGAGRFDAAGDHRAGLPRRAGRGVGVGPVPAVARRWPRRGGGRRAAGAGPGRAGLAAARSSPTAPIHVGR